jgi:hypothetical protein
MWSIYHWLQEGNASDWDYKTVFESWLRKETLTLVIGVDKEKTSWGKERRGDTEPSPAPSPPSFGQLDAIFAVPWAMSAPCTFYIIALITVPWSCDTCLSRQVVHSLRTSTVFCSHHKSSVSSIGLLVCCGCSCVSCPVSSLLWTLGECRKEDSNTSAASFCETLAVTLSLQLRKQFLFLSNEAGIWPEVSQCQGFCSLHQTLFTNVLFLLDLPSTFSAGKLGSE